MSDSPRVSIGMPVYNGERYLRSAIESILAQTFQDFELIISDNASTDNSLSICQEFADQDKRIRIIEQSKNIGAMANFNFVAKEARGEYFKWAAADDLCAPQFIEKCIEVLDRDSELAWCHSISDN